MKKIRQVILRYSVPDKLSKRYGHKLRGFFANQFSEVLFHNHKENGENRYGYPLIQYKIISGDPVIIGLEEGAELIIENFLDIKELVLGDKKYDKPEGRLKVNELELQVHSDLRIPKYKYELISPWLGLNQQNHKKYEKKVKDKSDEEQWDFFESILIGNILSFAKGIDWWIEDEIKVVPDLKPVDVKFKNKDMIGFVGEFYSNIKLPDKIGIGQSTARGFGTIKRSELV
ncbi:MAG: CRISPR-associated endonuclease Cas6 [Bacillota bacterium]